MSSDVAPTEDAWDVDALKAVRVFFDKKTNEPVLKYLASWAGFEEYWDEWITANDFGDPEQVTTFNAVIPPTFNRTKIGEIWYAPKAWIDSERAAYYAENPQAKEKISNDVFQAERKRLERKEEIEASTQGRKPFTLPGHEAIRLQNESEYNAYLRRLRKQQAKPRKPPPGQSLKGKAKFSGSMSIRPTPSGTQTPKGTVDKPGNAKRPSNLSDLDSHNLAAVKRKRKDEIIVGLRYKTRPVSHLVGLHSNDASDRSRVRSTTETRNSTPVYHANPQKPLSKDNGILSPATPPESASGSGRDSLFDASLDTDSESSDDSVPLARQAIVHKSRPNNQRGTNAILTSGSDSEPPLSKLAALGRKREGQGNSVSGQKNTKPDVNLPLSAASMPSRRLVQANEPTNRLSLSESRPNTTASPLTPIASKINAWNDVGKLIPLGKDRPVTSEPTSGSAVLPMNQPPARSGVRPSSTLSISDENHTASAPSPLFSGDDDNGADPPMDMDMADIGPAPDAISFMESVVNEIPLPLGPEPKTNWSPIDFTMQSTSSETELCKVFLQKVMPQPMPPSLKWIHKNGFKIRSFRPQAQLSLLLIGYEPWQSAQVAGYEDEDIRLLSAFTSYLYETNMCALADTAFDGAKLCFYPSQSPVLTESMRIPARSELRDGPLHLIVTVIKPVFRLEASGVAPVPRSLSKTYKPPQSLSSSRHAIERGIRMLRFPTELRTALQQRYPDAPQRKTYKLAAVESFDFRHPMAARIEERRPDEHAKYGVLHQEETLALMHTMKGMGYVSNKGNDSAAVVFIHNAAWDMLRHLLGLHVQKTHAKVWFFAYGPFHALDSRLWGVREIFKRGGIVTFTANSIIENASQLPKILQCIEESAIWMAFVSPLVVGWLQAILIRDPDHQGAMLGLLNLLEGAKKGQLSITSAPPHPWKTDDWSKWLEASSEICIPGGFVGNPADTQDAILDAAERALSEVIDTMPLSTDREREDTIDGRVFEDLRQMMFIPVLHTEYRRFIVLRTTRDGRVKDSIEHLTLQKLVDSDRAAFAPFPASSASFVPPITPSSATSMQGRYANVSPVPV